MRISVGLGVVSLAFSWQVALAQADEVGLSDVLNGEHRSAANQARDAFRHPAKTLTFFDVQPTHAVVEIWPGKGWYTEILAPWLRDRGQLYAAHFDPESHVAFFQQGRAKFDAKLAAQPALYNQVIVTTLGPPKAVAIAPEGGVDRVLTFRNVHNWLKSGTATQVFAAMFKALKPGGILGVVEHRAAPDTSLAVQIETGYVTERQVKELAQQAGFRYVAASEINANPKDSKDYPAGVWTLPPTLRLKAQDRARYQAIGESDRMTLKFAKP
ncbi:MAG: methyltransferase [Methylococcales bacterium]|nr:methyltransferase [Methylococcales bacterium]